MHPDPSFAWDDVPAMLAFVADHPFAHIFMPDAGVIHAPVIVTAAGALQFHVARRNRVAEALPGTRVVVSVLGPLGYVSPDWYASAGQVPTWNYVAVEAEGVARPLDRAALIAQIDAVAAASEAHLAPKPPWTRDAVPAAAFAAMLDAIAGFEIVVDEWRGTRKLSQNKPAADREGVVAALAALDPALAAAMRG